MVKDLLIILISSSLVSNVVLSQFLGLCPFLGVSKKTETAAGMGFAGFLLHMLVSFSLLAAVQGPKGNISRKGSLKQPVPFIPYITISFFAILLFL